MKRILIPGIITGLLCLSCVAPPFRGTIRYTSVNSNWKRIPELLKSYRHFTVGSELILKPDSFFTYTTCSAIFKGHWKTDPDSLYLQIELARWRNDSLQKNGFNGKWPLIPDRPYTFKIKGKYLCRLGWIKMDGKKLKSSIKLEKQN